MAKKGSSTGFARMRANIAASRGAYKQSRMQGFKITNDINDAIFGNLKTTMRGIGSELTSSNARQLKSLQQLARRSATSQKRTISKAQGTAANLYGIAGVAGAKPTLDAARAVAKGSKVQLAGAQRAGKTLANSQATVMGIMNAGVKEAQAGATAQTADALAYRAKEDAKLIAASQLELQKMRLQSQLDLETYKKKLALDENASGSSGVTQVASFAVQAFPALREAFNDPANEGKTTQEIAAEYISKTGIQDANAISLINSLASSMAVAGAGPQNPGSIAPSEVQSFVTNQLTDTLNTLYPNYAKHSKDVEKMLKAQLSVYAAGAVEQQMAASPDDPFNNSDEGGGSLINTWAAWLPETIMELATIGSYKSQTYDSGS